MSDTVHVTGGSNGASHARRDYQDHAEHVGICGCGYVCEPDGIGCIHPDCGTPFMAPRRFHNTVSLPWEAFTNLSAQWLNSIEVYRERDRLKAEHINPSNS